MESSLFSVVYSKQIRPWFLALAAFIICLPPEKPRDIAFFPHQSFSAFKDGGYREYGLLIKLLFPVPLLCILITRPITKRAVAWVESVQLDTWFDTWNFLQVNFKPEFLLNGKRSVIRLRHNQTFSYRHLSRFNFVLGNISSIELLCKFVLICTQISCRPRQQEIWVRD